MKFPDLKKLPFQSPSRNAKEAERLSEIYDLDAGDLADALLKVNKRRAAFAVGAVGVGFVWKIVAAFTVGATIPPLAVGSLIAIAALCAGRILCSGISGFLDLENLRRDLPVVLQAITDKTGNPPPGHEPFWQKLSPKLAFG